MATSRWILPNFKLIQALMYVIVTCKYEMDPIKHSREKVATPFFIIISLWGFFSTLERAATSAVGGPIWLNFELLRDPMHVINISKYKKDRIKTAEKKWQHHFLHYNPMGAICCHGNQSFGPILPKTRCSLSPILLMPLIKFHCNRPTVCRDIHV